ncbi:hypothetical protein BTR23_15630 [Alkalihalophilus pseudofirmus]|nr:hypothetical protein BTR23_15630 [Alkalihalophilus pseudofirmus]
MGKWFPVFLIIYSIPFLTGCWDYVDIESRANVLGISIDKATLEEIKKEGEITHLNDLQIENVQPIRLSVQIAIPGRLPLGTGGEQGGGGKETVLVLSVAGQTLNDAWENLQQQLSLRIFLGHLRVIIVSEDVAKEGVRDLNDFLRRSPEVRRAAWMVISQGEAIKHMEAAPELERVPTLYLVTAIEEAVKLGKFPEDFLGVFWSKLSSLGQEAYLPYITIKDKGNIEISGLAYFKDDRMVGVTTPFQIGNYMAIMQINPGGYSALVPIPEKNATVIFKADERKSKIKINFKNDIPQVTIKVHIEGELREKTNQQFDLNSEALTKMEQEIEEKAKRSFIELIKKTQEQQSDIFGFGEHIRAKHPRYWKQQIKTKERWQEMYKELPVEVDLIIDMRRIGMKNK